MSPIIDRISFGQANRSEEFRRRHLGAAGGFTGSLGHELGAFDVRVKLVEPGYEQTTRFAENTDIAVTDLIPEAYADFARPIFAEFANPALTTREATLPKRCC